MAIRKKVLLVDDLKTGHDETFSILDENNLDVYQARGPLAIKQVLSTEKIALIIWCEQKSHQPLVEDFFLIWEQYPNIPIIRIVTDIIPEISKFEERISASCPAQTIAFELPTILTKCIEASLEPPNQNKDLIFRKIFNKFRRKNNKEKPVSRILTSASLTSVDSEERRLLMRRKDK